MELQRGILVAAMLLTSVVGAGCMGPQEDPADTPEETETTPGQTVEAGATPTDVPGTTTVAETTGEEAQNATDGATGDETGGETTESGEGDG